MKKSYFFAALCATATCAAMVAGAAVKSSVFDDVKVWYKGSAGNAVGTKDADSNSGGASKIINLPNLSSGNAHGGTYNYWAWRMNYANEKVDCPYAGVALDSTPCMVVPKFMNSSGSEGTANIMIDDEPVTTHYWSGRRFCNLYFTSWMSDWESGTVCSNWTCVLRFRSDQVNAASGNGNKIIEIGSAYDSTAGKATGVNLNLNTPVTLADYACPRVFVGTDMEDFNYEVKIKSGRWVDCAIVVDGGKLDMWFCWNNGTDDAPTNRLAKLTKTYPSTKGLPTISANCRVNLASTKDGAFNSTITNGVYNSNLANKGFEGAFHQIAFWDRTLSDDEIREAMAGGTGRPNLIQVGIEGNGINEFASSGNVASVANSGAWENLNPSLTSGNPTATIFFNCPSLWAGLPQWLRLAGAGEGNVSIALNGETLGAANVPASGAASFFVPAGTILSGANTLVLTRTSGAPVLDAMRLGGSWQFGETEGKFSDSRYETAVLTSPDQYLFTPACGSDKLHNRGLNSQSDPRETYFDFFVPENMVGKFRGVFATRANNTGNSAMPYTFHANGVEIGSYTVKGGVTTEVKIPETAIVSGWNRLYWKTTGSGYWANINWHKFTLVDAPKPFVMTVR